MGFLSCDAIDISESSSEDNAGLSSCLRQSTLVLVLKEPILTILTSDKIVALQKYNLVVQRDYEMKVRYTPIFTTCISKG